MESWSIESLQRMQARAEHAARIAARRQSQKYRGTSKVEWQIAAINLRNALRDRGAL